MHMGVLKGGGGEQGHLPSPGFLPSDVYILGLFQITFCSSNERPSWKNLAVAYDDATSSNKVCV
jgi:hypothetical protein